MSIRSIIARPAPGGFAGRYVHSGGHPDRRVPVLLTTVQRLYGGDPGAAARHYLDDHPAGWSRLGPAVPAPGGRPAPYEDPYAPPEQCYCHGRWSGPAQLITHDTADPLWHEWIYLLRPDGLEVIRTDWRKSTRTEWASHLLPWNTDPAAPLPAALRA
ncbi:hypothetical protein [Kitasatospora arboriphila]|uniref:Uncharacterized protein n=1 Tax=Kitasatospora arboriphila TaxID=258052 RepID=A0ABN1TGP6_9ACTN